MDRTFGNALILVVVFELALTAVLFAFTDPLLTLFGATQTAWVYARTYYRIVALGCLFQGLTQLFCDFVRVSGHPVLGMFVTGVGAVTNIILDAVFVAGLGLGVAGAAWATVIGQALSAAFGASEEMLAIGVPALRTNFCITPILGFVMLVTTFFQSIAKPVPSIVITFLRQILLLIPFIWYFPSSGTSTASSWRSPSATPSRSSSVPCSSRANSASSAPSAPRGPKRPLPPGRGRFLTLPGMRLPPAHIDNAGFAHIMKEYYFAYFSGGLISWHNPFPSCRFSSARI